MKDAYDTVITEKKKPIEAVSIISRAYRQSQPLSVKFSEIGGK